MKTSKEGIKESIFRAPSREKSIGTVYFGGAVIFLLLYLFAGRSLFSIVMFSGFLLTGLAEFLPKQRNVLAGYLRITAIIVYISLLIMTFVQSNAII